MSPRVERTLFSALLGIVAIATAAACIIAVIALTSPAANAASPTYEVSVVVDGAMMDGPGLAAANLALADASVVFKNELGITINVTYMDLRTDVSANSQPIFLLHDLQSYRAATPMHSSADVTILLTARDLHIGDTHFAGYGTMGPACSAQSVAIVKTVYADLNGYTLAHELAHTIGVPHDGYGACEKSPPAGYIMAGFTSGGRHFSQCSIDVARANVADASCMFESSQPVIAAAVIDMPRSGGGTFGHLLLGALCLLVFGRLLAGRYEP